MTDVSVLGLGAMGGALARTLCTADFETTVWNRSASRATPLVKLGARHAETPAAAVDAAQVVLVCVDDYIAAESFLRTPETEVALRGRTLVQLSSGSPRQARYTKAWTEVLGALYVDGAIMGFPGEIGGRETTILVSGNPAGYEYAEPVLRALAGNSVFLGDDAGLASTLDQALLSGMLGLIVGVLNGVVQCEAGGFPTREYPAILGALMTRVGAQGQQVAQTAIDGSYRETDASLRTWAHTVNRMTATAREAGASDEYPRFLGELLNRATEAGSGEHDIAALVETLRKPPPKN